MTFQAGLDSLLRFLVQNTRSGEPWYLEAATAGSIIGISIDDFYLALDHLLGKDLVTIRWTHADDGREKRIGGCHVTLTAPGRLLAERLPQPNQTSATITEVTRRAIFDHLRRSEWHWSGKLEDAEFLNRLYDLTQIPSHDSRFENAADDIWQHRVNNPKDWPADWVFTDSRFKLIACDDETYLRFLAETLHPVVRTDADVAAMLAAYNGALRKDGWELVEAHQISERPVFAGRRLNQPAFIFDEPTGWEKADRQMKKVRTELKAARCEEDFQSIGLRCRETLITVAQTVFDPKRHPPTDGVAPSSADVNRMLASYFEVELRTGSSEVRAHAQAALKLAVNLQHQRTAAFREAALCAEATASVLNIVAVLSGRRDAK